MADPRITAARAELANRRALANAEFDAEERDLETAERVLRRLSGEGNEPKKPGRKPSTDGMPPQFAIVLGSIDARGGSVTRDALRGDIDALRLDPINTGNFQVLLSKMRGEHIETEGDIVRRKRISEEGADVS